MEAVKVILDYLDRNPKLEINSGYASDMVKFILDNPSYHYSIITSQRNLQHVIHDIVGLIRSYHDVGFDEHFIPRVLFKNDEYKELKEKLIRYYEIDLGNCKMTNKMWVEELAKCMIDSDDYVKDFNLNLKQYDDERK